MLNLQKIQTGFNLSNSHKYMHMGMLSLCVYYDLYGRSNMVKDSLERCLREGERVFIRGRESVHKRERECVF